MILLDHPASEFPFLCLQKSLTLILQKQAISDDCFLSPLAIECRHMIRYTGSTKNIHPRFWISRNFKKQVLYRDLGLGLGQREQHPEAGVAVSGGSCQWFWECKVSGLWSRPRRQLGVCSLDQLSGLVPGWWASELGSQLSWGNCELTSSLQKLFFWWH